MSEDLAGLTHGPDYPTIGGGDAGEAPQLGYNVDVASRIVIDRLEWDDWNREHIAKHAVVPEEVEELLGTSPLVRQTYKARYQLLGPTLSGRMLSVIVGAVPDGSNVWYVFSARPASRKERRLYESLTGDTDDREA